ncbi:amino acid adenylation domain-containing protein [Nocardia sp. NPDC051570]|uniref:amino acid adenylation domain-containing protein n=1 Tax=Nocardia sp. NPDC051570 TaxID=3364324 RepID=UPI0037A6D40B
MLKEAYNIGSLFTYRVAQEPSSVAISSAGRDVSYLELHHISDVVAINLLDSGLGPEEPVALLVDSSIDTLACMVGILKAGCSYLPLDARSPVDRIQYALRECGVRFVLVDTPGHAELGRQLLGNSGEILLAENLLRFPDEVSNREFKSERVGSPQQVAYIMYTSGSSGMPKGVSVTHGGVVSLALDKCWSGFEDRVLLHSPLAFDASIIELWIPLLRGGCIVLPPPSSLDARSLAETIVEQRVRNAFFTASLFGVLVEDYPDCLKELRQLWTGGETPSLSAVRCALRVCGDGSVVNAYGPTETTVMATCQPLTSGQGDLIPIGVSLNETQTYVLDHDMEQVAEGELFVGGSGVSRGYVGRPGLTAERFLPDPFGPAGARMYKTGDLVRRHPDGVLEFVGRRDRQVKIRGHRIELEEIESQLSGFDDIAAATVTVAEDRPGEKTLRAYVVPRSTGAESATKVSEWRQIYDTMYTHAHEASFGEDFTGWLSSYDNELIPLEEMRQWRANIVERILELRPSVVLEIGIGTGLLMAQLAPDCVEYWGTDISGEVIGALRKHLADRPELAKRVNLRVTPADALDVLPKKRFDAIILNSVVQYFPDIQYLEDVLDQAAQLLAPGGAIFVGDVRNFRLVRQFHTGLAIVGGQYADHDALSRAVERRVRSERELLVAPDFFAALAQERPWLSGVDIRVKRGRYDNELSRYRFDVVLHTPGRPVQDLDTVPVMRWSDIRAVNERLTQGIRSIRIAGVPNPRLPGYVAALSDSTDSASGSAMSCPHPEDLHELAARHGYRVVVTWSGEDAELLDAVFWRPDRQDDVDLPCGQYVATGAVSDLYCHANVPRRWIDKPGWARQLADHLRSRVPDYMVPSAFVILDALPLTRNGKVDLRALPAPETTGSGRRPRTEVEELLCGLFAEVLHREAISIDDGFFELGGHSLLATRLIAKIEPLFQVRLQIKDILDAPSAAELTQRLGMLQGSRRRRPSLIPRQAPEPMPLSYSQRRLWFINQMEALGNPGYHVPLVFRLRANLDSEALRAALVDVIKRHEPLRTVFPAGDRSPRQRVLGDGEWKFALPVTYCSAGERDERLAEMARVSFDLEHDLPIRCELLCTDDETVLLLVLHHVAADGWSITPLARDIGRAYTARSTATHPEFPPLPVQYRDYTLWQQDLLGAEDDPTSLLSEQLIYWTRTLTGIPDQLPLSTDHPRPAVTSHRGDSIEFTFDAELHNKLDQLARHTECTPFMVLQTAVAGLLTRLGAGEDIVIGSPVAGRTEAVLEDLVGFFVNTIPLRIDTSGNPTFIELLYRVRLQCLNAYAHQDLPFDLLVEKLNPPRTLNRHPIFQVALSFLDVPEAVTELEGLSSRWVLGNTGAAKFDLALTFQAERTDVGKPAGLIGSVEYATDLFDADTIHRLITRLTILLRHALSNPDQPLDSLTIVADDELAALPTAGRELEPRFTRHGLMNVFHAEATRRADEVAVRCGERELSYRDLAARADTVARYLAGAGVSVETCVGMVLDRGVEAVVAFLGVAQSGGTYVPLDPRSPATRMAAMVADCNAQVVVVDTVERAAFVRGFVPDHVHVVTVEEAEAAGQGMLPSPASFVGGDQLAYVIYTSGSTGIPKGVGVTQRNILDLAGDRRWTPAVTERVLLHSSLAFDASTFEMWIPLLRGGSIVIAPPGEVDVPRLSRVILEAKVTAAFLTTALFNLIVSDYPEAVAGLRQLWTGGEVASSSAFARALKLVGPEALVHVYGPTEATTFALCHLLREVADSAVPLGTPMDGVRAYVLDDRGLPVGIGIEGELYLAGAGLARGYIDQPGLTAQRFVPDPFGAPGARMYQTGDLVRWRPDRSLEFIGRKDRQVKLRGFRIEVGEIESLLARQPEVAQALVTVRGEGSDVRHLAAYLVPVSGQNVDAAVLRNRLREHIPDYMVPTAFAVLERIPLTPNGKIDMRALPEPAVKTGSREPESPTEFLLSDAFTKTLGLPKISVDDNFFDLGGHSMLATRLASHLSDRGIEIGIKDIFHAPTVAGLAAAVDARSGDRGDRSRSAINPTTSPGIPVPLSFAQQRLWFLDQLWPGRSDYNVPFALRLIGDLDEEALRRSIREVVRRHDVLRTRYEVRADEPYQIVEDEWEPQFEVVDYYSAPPADVFALADARIRELAARPFDLAAAPPVRFALARLFEQEHVLLMVIHHIATDGRSTQLLWRDIATRYREHCSEPGAPLQPLVLRYADYAAWQRQRLDTPDLASDLDYWRHRLTGLEPVELPTDRPRGPSRSGHGAQIDFHITPSLREQVILLSRRFSVTPFMTFFTAFQVLVARYSGQRDVAVGTPVAGRTRPELEELVGLFVNTLVLRSEINPLFTFSQLLARTRDELADAYSHSELPFERLVSELQPDRDLARNPIFQLMFSMSESASTITASSEWTGLRAQPYQIPFMAAQFDLEISLADNGNSFLGSVYYAVDLFDPATIDRLARHYVQLLQELIRAVDRPVSTVQYLTSEEDRQALRAWNNTKVDFELDYCLHELVSRQARRTPEAVAVEHGSLRLNYAELDCMSTQFAHLLRAGGLRVGQPVGILLDRSLELVVCLLGVLKAGGVFIPVDPDLPPMRAQQLLDAAGAVLCVSDDVTWAGDISVVPADLNALADLPIDPPGVSVRPEDLVSIYYTSGSTGRPKGVANTHLGWVNRLWWMHKQHGLLMGEGVLHKTVLSFDDSAVELFWPLIVGGRVVLLDPGMHRDPRAILRATIDHEVSVLQFVPSMLGLFLDELTDETVAELHRLRHVISSGEVLRPELIARFHERFGRVGCKLHNQWGPTEASIDASFHTCMPQEANDVTVPIGHPIANCQVHVLDESMLSVPPGVEGELFIGGMGLARGYWNDPAKTAEAFVPNPFQAGQRLYRTGDRATRAGDGTLIFRGRRDHQVKIRGVRLELGEVESVLSEHPGVANITVTKWEPNPGDHRLVGYVVPKTAESRDADELLAWARSRLPSAAVPGSVVFLDEMPLTASGKVDRKRLPQPGRNGHGSARSSTFTPPRTECELLVAEVWDEFLEVRDVHDNFFAQGGHSLLATRVVSRLSRVLDVELPLLLLFENPTIAGLAAAVESALMDSETCRAEAPSIVLREAQ